jgi:hypothetical protein
VRVVILGEVIARRGVVAVAVGGGADHFVAHGGNEMGALMVKVEFEYNLC